MSENALTELPSGIFSSLTNLTELDLSDNALTTLDAGVFSSLTALTTLSLNNNDLTELPPRIFSSLTNLTGVQVDGQATESLPLNIIIQEISNEMAVVEVVQGVPFTSVTVTLSIIGGTFPNDTQTIDVTLSKTQTQSLPFSFTSVAATLRITSISSTPENILTSFNSLTRIGYSGFRFVSGAPLSFGVEERIEEAGASILPIISQELISGLQNVVSGRIGRLATNPVIVPPTAQVAGQSTLSELLVFGAQTFDKVHNQKQSFTLESLLQETSFALPVNGEEFYTIKTGFDSLAVWGSGDYQSLSGGDSLSWDGSVVSFHLGSDMKFTREVLGGGSVSWSRGMFDYKDRGSGQEGSYDLELWSVHPYGGWTPVPWFNLWIVGGYGFGEVTVKDEGIVGDQSSGVQAYSGSFGMSIERVSGGGTIRLKGQTAIAIMEVEDNGEMISSLTTESYQQRVSLEASYRVGVLVPALEVGWRNDEGDGETGNGLEVGGGLRYVTAYGLTAEVDGRWLALHSGEIEEWGVGGSIRFEPGSSQGQGFWMSITPEWGETGKLWEAKDGERGGRLGVEGGYGLSIGEVMASPFFGVVLSDRGYRSYRVGSGVVVGDFSLTFEGERRLTGLESLLVEGSLRF